nr:MAG TPA: hypothetical protein [Caudoviricetes sp.]
MWLHEVCKMSMLWYSTFLFLTAREVASTAQASMGWMVFKKHSMLCGFFALCGLLNFNVLFLGKLLIS